MSYPYEIEHGEYGQKLRGIRGKQLLPDATYHGKWYLVEYVIENMDDALGSLEITSVNRVVDEYGMCVMSIVSVSTDEYDLAERQMASLVGRMVREVG